ncbi:bifunctional sugar-1-phosphate nucleotidylyltransferase/acetyltransferase [Hyperthermus butylicus]|uniref:Acetyltransferase n=1 Tax=Hyperthermus butylicus (strain DSM 5456 / JCM 9403 / PLM1-5) TaxID=415426 RepID=A2BLL9_HYPBU|nr:bifunctional sugar-1-phosphate nucleotidylyltransferase/acetyltransferase [Hyperthermus butylicus]ABM80880.1 Acetyltransferase [Hyperthermus butylicus DSM 5456]
MSRYAIVLAAGRGERLWPLTSTRPKPLLPLPGGETLLSRIMGQLRRLVDGFVVVVGPGWAGDTVKRHLEEKGYSVIYAVQESPRGTGDAVRAAVEKLPRSVDEVLIVYGDLLVSGKLLEDVAAAGAPALAAKRHERPWDYGVVRVNGRGCLSGLVEKPADAKPGELVNTGVYLLPREILEESLEVLKPSPRGELEFTDAVARIAGKACLRVVSGDWLWMDVGRPWDLFDAYRAVWEERFPGLREPLVEGEVEPGATLKGPVYVARGAVVRSYSYVEGPAWIEGEVGPFARIRPWSFLHPGSRAATHTEVKASILMRGARAPHLNYVGDSILGEGVNLGAGTVTANLRFDHATVRMRLKGKLVDTGRNKLGAIIGDYAQTGINVSTLPGLRIGAYSWVYPGMTVAKDVPDCVLARPKPGGGVEYVDIAERVGCPEHLRRSRRY